MLFIFSRIYFMDKSEQKLFDMTRITLLFDLYGKLLPDRSREVINLYLNEDLSIVEIAEILGITRQAVYDSLKLGTKKLEHYEEVLAMNKTLKKQANVLEQVKDLIEKNLNTDAISLIEQTLNQYN